MPAKNADSSDISRLEWLSQKRLGDALVRAAFRHRPKALDADRLLAASGLIRWVTRDVLDQVLAELGAAGRLLVDRRPNPRALWETITLYSAPRGDRER